MKTCTFGNLQCPYANMTKTGFMCNYQGYCDYQLPRDSRGENERHTEEQLDNLIKKIRES